MEKTTMTGPQLRVVEFLEKKGEVEEGHLKKYGLDVRAANNLVKARVLTLTGGVYRLRERKAQAANDGAPSTPRLSPRSRRPDPAAVAAELASELASEPASEAVSEPAPASEPAAEEPAESSPVPSAPASEPAPAPASEPVSEPVVEQAPVTVESEPSTKPEKAAAKGRAAKAAKAAKDAAAKPAKPAKAEKPAINPTGKCLCGCGAELGDKRRFAIGHDAKLHSLVLKVLRGKADKSEVPATDATRAYLRTAPWMTDELREAIAL